MTATVDSFFDSAVPETSAADSLVRNGRYHIGGDQFTRVTTFASSLDDRYQLERWQQRMVAAGLVERQDLYAQVAANAGNKGALNDLCDEAIEAAKGSAGANLGTALHSFTERVDRGEEITIPAPWDADIAAYLAALDVNGVRVDPALMECVVICRELGVAGRFDRLLGVDGRPLPMIGDLKTGKVEHSWTTIAIQLAIYANADEIYDPVTQTTAAMPQVDLREALVIHLPAGQATCTLHTVDIAAGWEAAQLAASVREWRKRRSIAVEFESTTVTRAAWLLGRATTLKERYPAAFAELAASWPSGVPTFKQGGHTVAHVQEIDALLTGVEARHAVEFGDPDPARRLAPPAVIGAFRRRVAALPPDLTAVLVARCGEQGVSTTRITVAAVPDLEMIVGEIEASFRARCVERDAHLAAVAESDQALRLAVRRAVAGEDYVDTRRNVDTLAAVAAAMSGVALAYGEPNDDGVIDVVTVGAEQRLVDWYGSKKDALAACKEIAEAVGLAKPRSVADVSASPALFAHVYVARQATTPEQGAQAA